MNATISLSYVDLSIAAILVLLVALLSFNMKLGITKRICVAALRTAVQLSLIGFILTWLFSQDQLIWIGLISLVMLLAAGREVLARQQRRMSGLWGFGIGTTSMFLSSFIVTILALATMIGPEPWYTPRYAIPLLGMLLGNTMTCVALAMDRITQEAWQQHSIIEERLMLGQTASEAIGDIRRDSMRTGLMPIINAMAAAGLVSLPGMMTGQILAGNPPLEAVKYQILIMFLIVSGAGLGTIAAIGLTSLRLFDSRDRLRLDHLRDSS